MSSINFPDCLANTRMWWREWEKKPLYFSYNFVFVYRSANSGRPVYYAPELLTFLVVSVSISCAFFRFTFEKHIQWLAWFRCGCCFWWWSWRAFRFYELWFEMQIYSWHFERGAAMFVIRFGFSFGQMPWTVNITQCSSLCPKWRKRKWFNAIANFSHDFRYEFPSTVFFRRFCFLQRTFFIIFLVRQLFKISLSHQMLWQSFKLRFD